MDEFKAGQTVQIYDAPKFNSLWRSAYCVVKGRSRNHTYYILEMLGTHAVGFFKPEDFRLKHIQLNRGI